MITENGWPSCGPDQLDDSPIPGTNERVSLQRGQPNAILKAFMGALNKYVESVDNGRGSAQDEGGWTATNSVPTSNHLGGTAFDYNWSDHPMGPQVPDPAAGWQGSAITNWQPEEPRIRELLNYFTYKGLQLVWWANDWDSPHDSMHFQMGYNTFGDARVQEFIDNCIRPDGLPRFFDDDHEPASPDLVALLAEAMGNTDGVNYGSKLVAVQQCLQECECNSVNRISMWMAQVGTESAGLKYMEETADGSEYEGRGDLGNTQPGDGPRFKGRGPIQVTGRHNYTALSQWAFDQGLVPTSTYFVDSPDELATDQYGFVGVTWYWTTQRPMNDASDAGNVELATQYVNGGNHGLPDRKYRYANCQNMGQRLLALVEDTGDDWMSDPDIKQMIAEIHRETVTQKSPSRSFMAEDAGLIDTPLGIDWNSDGNVWTLVLTEAYRLNVPKAVHVVETIAENGVFPGTYASEDYNKWLAEFGQAYCKGLVAEKQGKQTTKATKK